MCFLSFYACNDRETMYQVATLQSLMVGNYDGYVSIGELKKYGDIGLGTFDRVNGEMIVLDGQVYQALGDGSVKMAEDSQTTPFSTVTFFEADITASIAPFDNLPALTQQLDSIVNACGSNLIYALRLDLKARSVTFRSELPQDKPYGPLAEVLPDKQRSFTCELLDGCLVAVRFPAFFAGQNTPGWHFHFISADRRQGGHLLDVSSSEISVAELDATNRFLMFMPSDESFSHRDLSEDMSEDIRKVER